MSWNRGSCGTETSDLFAAHDVAAGWRNEDVEYFAHPMTSVLSTAAELDPGEHVRLAKWNQVGPWLQGHRLTAPYAADIELWQLWFPLRRRTGWWLGGNVCCNTVLKYGDSIFVLKWLLSAVTTRPRLPAECMAQIREHNERKASKFGGSLHFGHAEGES